MANYSGASLSNPFKMNSQEFLKKTEKHSDKNFQEAPDRGKFLRIVAVTRLSTEYYTKGKN